MRILQTFPTYAPSLDGVSEVIRNISERLAQRGHDVHVATSAIESEAADATVRGVHVHRFKARGNLTVGLGGDIERYRQFVRSGDWDVLVNHCLRVWTTDALLLGEVGSCPWPSILVTHGVRINNPVIQRYCAEISNRVFKYSAWVCVSRVSGEVPFAQKLRWPVPTVITNGVDMSEWRRAPVGLRAAWGIGKKPWVVNVSNHSPLKGHRSFFQLSNRLGEGSARLTLIAGDYPMAKWGLGRYGISGGCAYECRLRAALPNSPIDLRTNLPRHEVVSAIQEADLVVSTSRLEANSLVLLESMAAGTPWVSFDVGTARQNVGGVVADNLDEMAKVVTELLRDPQRRKSLGSAGRARVAANHDWDSITEQYEQLYEGAIEQSCKTAFTS